MNFVSFQGILGAILVTREQLTDEQFSQLLDLKLTAVREVLSRLQPLVQSGHGKPYQVLHTSFTDFLCDPERCGAMQWSIDAAVHHCNMASGCLQLMRQDLKFNICDIEISYRRHIKIEGIQNRTDTRITPVLMYVCQYWAEHLESGSSTEPSSRCADEVMNFIESSPLYWIEMFSLKNPMSMISVILRTAASWAKVAPTIERDRCWLLT